MRKAYENVIERGIYKIQIFMTVCPSTQGIDWNSRQHNTGLLSVFFLSVDIESRTNDIHIEFERKLCSLDILLG